MNSISGADFFARSVRYWLFFRRRSPLIFRKPASRSSVGIFSSRRVAGDGRDDAADELIVDLDAALRVRLREHLMIECRERLVARRVAREDLNRRVEILIEEQREERDAQSRDRL